MMIIIMIVRIFVFFVTATIVTGVRFSWLVIKVLFKGAGKRSVRFTKKDLLFRSMLLLQDVG